MKAATGKESLTGSKTTFDDPPPGVGLVAVTDAVAAVAMFAAGTVAVNCEALTKLVAMTHAKKCEARSEAADALGTLRGKKAKLALKKLAHAKFKDEARNPGIFSCSSRRAAQKALERQARG